jgi:hypothetical protein
MKTLKEKKEVKKVVKEKKKSNIKFGTMKGKIIIGPDAFPPEEMRSENFRSENYPSK